LRTEFRPERTCVPIARPDDCLMPRARHSLKPWMAGAMIPQLRKTAPCLRVTGLEDRLAPAGLVSLLSRADPTHFADTAGGLSSQYVYDFGNGATEVADDQRLMSADGRFSVFASRAPNVVEGQVDHDAYAYADVFLYDHVLHQTTLV